eukprot:g71548.t1
MNISVHMDAYIRCIHLYFLPVLDAYLVHSFVAHLARKLPVLVPSPGDTRSSPVFFVSACVPNTVQVLYQPLESCARFPNNTLTIGVVQDTYSGNTSASALSNYFSELEKWQPTFQDVLNEYFTRFSCYFRVAVLSPQQVESALREQRVDFLFGDAGVYTQHQARYGLSAIASITLLRQSFPVSQYGGVVLRSDRQNNDWQTLLDLVSEAQGTALSVCTASTDSFAVWHALGYELLKMRSDLSRVFRGKLTETRNHHLTLQMVMSNECDVGVVPTCLLEDLDFPKGGPAPVVLLSNADTENRDRRAAFPCSVSTDLYPERPLARLSHVPSELAQLVAVPLMALREFDPAAIAGSFVGFRPPDSYSSISNVRYQLNLFDPISGACAPGQERVTRGYTRCEPCPPGKHSASGLRCNACAPGFATDKAGAIECVRCAPGFSTLQFGETRCRPDETGVGTLLKNECAALPTQHVKIGMLLRVTETEEQLRRQWAPTFEGVLDSFFNRFGCRFELVVLPADRLEDALNKRQVDFLFVQPGDFAIYQKQHGLVARATLVRALPLPKPDKTDLWVFCCRQEDPTVLVSPYDAGVFYRSATSALSFRTIGELAQLLTATTVTAASPVNSTISQAAAPLLTACTTERELLPWGVAVAHVASLGLELEKLFKQVLFCGSGAAVVQVMQQRQCDVALLSLETTHNLPPDQLEWLRTETEVLDVHGDEALPGVSISTELFPQWALASLPHVLPNLSAAISLPLSNMYEGPIYNFSRAELFSDDKLQWMSATFDYGAVVEQWLEAAVIGRHAGTVPALDYTSSLRLMYDLALIDPDTAPCYPGSARNASAWPPCVACPPGKVSNGTDTECEDCAVGSFTNDSGQSLCWLCPHGNTTLGPGASHCVDQKDAEVYTTYSRCIAGERWRSLSRLSNLTDFLPEPSLVPCHGSYKARLALLAVANYAYM